MMNARSIDKAKRELRTIYEDYIARVFHRKCRVGSDDIIIGSYPKSGRTWVRFFVGAYISYLYELGIDVDWNNFAALSPGYLCNKRDGLRLFPEGLPRVIFSHNKPIGRYFPGRKVVYITRNFLDILVSYYFFHKHRGNPCYADMSVDAFVRNEFDFAEAIERINYFSRQLERARAVLLMPYESMRMVPELWFKRFIWFTNYKYDEDAFHKALEHSSFSSMRRMEREQRKPDSEEGFHMRQGAIGEAAEHLDGETVSYVQTLLNHNLKGILKEYYLGRTSEDGS